MTILSHLPLSLQSRVDDDLSEIFHESTKLSAATIRGFGSRVTAYLTSPVWTRQTGANRNAFPAFDAVDLPAPAVPQVDLCAALRARVSARRHRSANLPAAHLSAILKHASSATRSVPSQTARDVTMRFRPYPSAGGLYPIELYAIALRVDGVEPGVLHYSPHADRLARLDDGVDLERLAQVLVLSDEELQRTSAAFVLTTTSQRSTVKYGTRGYRFALLEAGHLSQNMLLVAAGLGVPSLCWGGYLDDPLASLVQADGVDEAVVAVVLVGGPDA